MKKVIAVTPFWGRENVSKIFWQNCQDINLDVVACVTRGDTVSELLASRHALKTVYCNNLLGKKWQSGINACRDLEFDYILIIGSDDLVSPLFFTEHMNSLMESGYDYIGTTDAVAVSLMNKLCRYWEGYQGVRQNESVGAGRLISKNALNEIDYQLIDPTVKRGIDDVMHRKLVSAGFENKMVRTGMKPYRLRGSDKWFRYDQPRRVQYLFADLVIHTY